MSNLQIVSDYEELFKIREFSKKRKEDSLMQSAYECTYERLQNDLRNQYIENLEDKINRWINISRVQYFQDVLPITFYIQAKMLYRDGFYEAAISVSRSICEVICYEELSKQPHPFHNLALPDKYSPSFSVLKQFLLLPKKVEKKLFQKTVIARIVDNNLKDKDSNFLKSSYELKSDGYFYLKVSNAKKEENLNRFIKIFKSVSYNGFETFPANILEALEYVWTNGSSYVHVKKSSQDAKADAYKIIDQIGYVLFYLYKADPQQGAKITSAYSCFQDICTNFQFGMDFFSNPDDAMRGYYNLPSKAQIERMLKVVGQWEGEWGINEKITKSVLIFKKEGEYINCYLFLNDNSTGIPMGISFFGDYFHINQINGDRTKHHFQLSFLDINTLVGQHKQNLSYAIFKRTTTESN